MATRRSIINNTKWGWALALDWRGERVHVSADLYRQRERLDGANYFGISTIANTVTQLPGPFDGRKNLAPPWSFTINTTTVAMARAEWDVRDVLSVYAAYGRREGSYDALITGSSLLDDAGTVMTRITRQFYHQIVHSGETGIRGTFATGAITHNWSLAATLYEAEYGATFAGALAPISNIYALDYGPMPDFSGFSTAKPDMLLRTELHSVALADRMAFMDERVQLTLGACRQRIRSSPLTPFASTQTAHYEKSAWSPTLALLLKPVDKLSVYGSYIQGLSQGGPAPAFAANAFETFPAIKTKQVELGMKMDWGRFNTTAALFHITRPNGDTDPITNRYAISGEQRNRGLELNLFGEAAPGLRLMGGLAFMEATLRGQAIPVNNGKQAVGAPKFVARLGAEYDLPAVPGLTWTGHVNHVGKRTVTADNCLAASAYVTLDMGARYVTRIGATAVTLRANVSNLFDKVYWAGTLGAGLGAPRTFMLSASVDF